MVTRYYKQQSNTEASPSQLFDYVITTRFFSAVLELAELIDQKSAFFRPRANC